MAVKKKKQRSNLSKQKQYKVKSILQRPRNILLILLLGIFVFIGLNIVIKTYQADQQKKELIAQHQELEKIANKIESNYASTERSSKRYCDQTTGFKYQKGNIYCVVEVKLEYSSKNDEESNTIKQKLEEMLSLKFHAETSVSNQDPPVFGEVKKGDGTRVNYLVSLFGDGCTISLSHPVEMGDLTLEISCSKATSHKYFI